MIAAAAVGATAAIARLIATGDAKPAVQWRGAALGGEARIALYGVDRTAAETALTAAAAEIERMEDIFSLHRAGSQISRLNGAGHIETPAADLVSCLNNALAMRTRTSGVFDPTVQRLWRQAASGGSTTPELLATAGMPVAVTPSRITLPTGVEVTLNGIAQGRIADRITEVLAAHGFSDIVVDAGELRLPGRERRAVGIPAAKSAVSVAEVAVATSEPKSLVFDQRSFRHHLIDPATGMSPRYWQSVSVFAATAETADALSTAFALMPHDRVADEVAALGGVAVIGADAKGRIRRFGDPNRVSFGGNLA